MNIYLKEKNSLLTKNYLFSVEAQFATVSEVCVNCVNLCEFHYVCIIYVIVVAVRFFLSNGHELPYLRLGFRDCECYVFYFKFLPVVRASVSRYLI